MQAELLTKLWKVKTSQESARELLALVMERAQRHLRPEYEQWRRTTARPDYRSPDEFEDHIGTIAVRLFAWLRRCAELQMLCLLLRRLSWAGLWTELGIRDKRRFRAKCPLAERDGIFDLRHEELWGDLLRLLRRKFPRHRAARAILLWPCHLMRPSIRRVYRLAVDQHPELLRLPLAALLYLVREVVQPCRGLPPLALESDLTDSHLEAMINMVHDQLLTDAFRQLQHHPERQLSSLERRDNTTFEPIARGTYEPWRHLAALEATLSPRNQQRARIAIAEDDRDWASPSPSPRAIHAVLRAIASLRRQPS